MKAAHGEIFFNLLVTAILVELRVTVDIDFIIVIRVVLIGIQRNIKTFLCGMFRIDIGFVGVKRTERIGGVHTGTPAVVRNDIDSPAECVTAQFDRYDTFVHLHTFGETYRNIVQPESGTHTVHRYTVDEDFHMPTGKAVQSDVGFGTHASRGTDFHPADFVNDIGQVHRRAFQLGRFHQ